MGTTRHERSFVDFERPYEQNIVGLRGIVYFGLGLLALIVITFALMWALLGVFDQQAREAAAPTHPLMPTERDRLPPEPRLQVAPGFGVESEQGRVNLELQAPGAEYREMRKQWEDIWKNGAKACLRSVSFCRFISRRSSTFRLLVAKWLCHISVSRS